MGIDSGGASVLGFGVEITIVDEDELGRSPPTGCGLGLGKPCFS